MSEKEMVNHPQHYGGDTEYECIKVLKAWNTKEEFLGFCKDNAIKYLCRVGKKDADLQEWKKALWYIQQGVNYLEENVSKSASFCDFHSAESMPTAYIEKESKKEKTILFEDTRG